MTRIAKGGQPASHHRAPPEASYPVGWRHKSIAEQVRSFVSGELAPELRGLDASHVDAIASRYRTLVDETDPDGMEGWVVHPKPSRFVACWASATEWPLHNRALWRLLAILARRQGGFFDAVGGAIGPEHYRLCSATSAALQLLEASFPGDFLVYRAQTGMLRRTSVAKARRALAPAEFGLEAFGIGCFLLTHPERLLGAGALGLDAIGAEYASEGAKFSLAPYFISYDMARGIAFGVYDVNEPARLTGAATGLLPP